MSRYSPEVSAPSFHRWLSQTSSRPIVEPGRPSGRHPSRTSSVAQNTPPKREAGHEPRPDRGIHGPDRATWRADPSPWWLVSGTGAKLTVSRPSVHSRRGPAYAAPAPPCTLVAVATVGRPAVRRRQPIEAQRRTARPQVRTQRNTLSKPHRHAQGRQIGLVIGLHAPDSECAVSGRREHREQRRRGSIGTPVFMGGTPPAQSAGGRSAPEAF